MIQRERKSEPETAVEQLTHNALELPLRERAKLAHILIASIDESSDEEFSPAWDGELESRVHDIQKGNVTGIPADEVFAKIKEKYH